MHQICHRIEVEANPAATFRAVTEADDFSQWWTNAETQPKVGGRAEFRFGPDGTHVVVMQFTKVEQTQVRFKCVEGPWVDTGEFVFDIQPHERGTVVHFTHLGWPEQNDFFRHCNSKWGFFLAASLKSYLENGTGTPHPNEPNI